MTDADEFIRPAVDETWKRDAACRGLDPDLFFAERGSPTWRDAIAVCRGCSVRQECLQYAIDGCIKHGIFGGLLPKERRRGRRLLEGGPSNDPRCGTNAGYHAHHNRNEDPCRPRRDAQSEYKVVWLSERRASA